MKKFVLVLSLFSVTHLCRGEEIPGQTLLSYFSANCPRGEFTSISLAHSNALIESLRSISQDPDCKSVAGAISQLGLLNSHIANLTKVSATNSQLAEFDRQEQELLIQVSQNTHPETLEQINTRLRDLQVSRAGVLGRQKAESELATPEKMQVMASIAQISDAAFTQIAGNTKCMDKNPNVLNAATGMMATVGATVAMVNPALGIGLTAGAVVLGGTVEGLRKHKNSREIRRISDGSIATEAYKCALETMSDHWCQMRDAETFLDFRREHIDYPRLGGTLGSAVGLSDKEIPVLLEWLNKIRSGVAPSNPAESSRQSEALSRQTYVRILEKSGIAFINDNRALYKNATEEERKNILKTVIRSIQPAVMTEFRNPFYETKSYGYVPFYLLGLNDDSTLRDSLGNYISIESWTGWATYKPTEYELDNVEKKYSEWVQVTAKKVNDELAQILQPDTLLTLTIAFEEQDTRFKISPMTSLKNLIGFLELNQPGENRIAFRKIFKDTLFKLKKIHDITDKSVMSETPVQISDVQEIYEAAQLQNGTVVMESRLNMIVRLSLLEYIRTVPQEDQILVAQLLASERFSNAITKYNGKTEVQVRNDINRANGYSNNNLNAFIEVFGKNLKRIMSKSYKEEKKLTGTLAAAKKYSRTELCFLLLAVPKLTRDIDLKLCEGLKFDPKIKGGPESITLTSELYKADYKDRACHYREFNRKSIIYETWGIK